jgi:hypothetical protein
MDILCKAATHLTVTVAILGYPAGGYGSSSHHGYGGGRGPVLAGGERPLMLTERTSFLTMAMAMEDTVATAMAVVATEDTVATAMAVVEATATTTAAATAMATANMASSSMGTASLVTTASSRSGTDVLRS